LRITQRAKLSVGDKMSAIKNYLDIQRTGTTTTPPRRAPPCPASSSSAAAASRFR
jgi:hypothetical protein